MAKYVKKPVVIEAFQWFPDDQVSWVPVWYLEGCELGMLYPEYDGTLTIKTLEGNMTAKIGDYVIKGVRGEFYPCRRDIFEETYDKVDQ